MLLKCVCVLLTSLWKILWRKWKHRMARVTDKETRRHINLTGVFPKDQISEETIPHVSDSSYKKHKLQSDIIA